MECALVLPLFFLGMTALISMMDYYRIQTVHLSELCQNAKVAAAYTYNPAGEGLTDIVLPDAYSYQPAGGIFGLPRVLCLNVATVRSWNGKEHVTAHASLVRERMVYVTATGTVYHRSLGCRYLRVSVTAIPAGEIASRRNRSAAVASVRCRMRSAPERGSAADSA